MDAFKGLKKLCRQLGFAGKKGHGAPVVIFLFVAGHGYTYKNDQYWVLNSGESINLEDFVRSCSAGYHIKFIAIF